jgi:hypothetical protein
VNAFWIHEGCDAAVPTLSVAEAFRRCGVRQERDEAGALTYRSPRAARASIDALPLLDVRSGATTSVGAVAGPD